MARPHADRAIIWGVLALCAVGVVAVYSAVSFLAETKSGGDTERFLFRHLLRVGLALGAAGVLSLVDYRRLARVSKLALLGSLALLVAVQVMGAVTNGAQRWIELGPISFQPSDLAKVALIVHVAVLLAKKQAYIGDLGRGFAPLLAWIAPTILLIGMEDLSTAAVLSATMGAMLFVGRVRVLHMAAVALAGLVLAVGFLSSSPQRAARLEAWTGVELFASNDEAVEISAQDENYQADQARIAFAMGGVAGVGPGKSLQRDFLPAPYNDFIFAIIAEEYGLVGAGVVLFVFVWLLGRGFLRVAKNAPDPLGLFLATGLTTAVVLGGFVNAAVATGLLPVTGLAMPFVSYGGTSMIATGAMVGILLNVSRHSKTTA
ncbi:putative peptidoglycan glycosyltransferase FtsW [Rubrivirga sp. S365]|uniref:FtsW/RodA/SpoVE family cell cycle protein n=1 Tax=Rubrivirga sp. S365 TaxID=3076080 RepID=UPI0028C97217|nr:putative peptidoglycan glycosyltransferase FtsW [Rubrivirga sp. S365]MDT7855722.1 putative peptidoglycan glycosyltransferase FtsW [Rubrivirga sp. S365]